MCGTGVWPQVAPDCGLRAACEGLRCDAHCHCGWQGAGGLTRMAPAMVAGALMYACSDVTDSVGWLVCGLPIRLPTGARVLLPSCGVCF
jgi:hypothetical protein